ncbi:MAG: hypothetical protein ACYTBP_06440 [Planctomycetota bacterium]
MRKINSESLPRRLGSGEKPTLRNGSLGLNGVRDTNLFEKSSIAGHLCGYLFVSKKEESTKTAENIPGIDILSDFYT